MNYSSARNKGKILLFLGLILYFFGFYFFSAQAINSFSTGQLELCGKFGCHLVKSEENSVGFMIGQAIEAALAFAILRELYLKLKVIKEFGGIDGYALHTYWRFSEDFELSLFTKIVICIFLFIIISCITLYLIWPHHA